MSSKDASIRRLFVFTLSGNNVSKGVIMEFLGKKYDVRRNLDKLIANADRQTIEDFNGTIFTYDVNYSQLGSAVFENGVKLEAKAQLTTLRGKSLPELKSLANHQRDLYSKQKIAAAFDFRGLATTTGSGQTCVTVREITEYYTNGVLTSVKIEFFQVCTPNPPEGNSSGESSGSGSGSSSSNSQQNPDYGGPSTGGTTVVNGPPPPPQPKDPCAEKATVNAINKSTSLRNAVTSIIASTNSTTHEWGSMILHNGSQSITDSSITATTPSSNGQHGKWATPAFQWTQTSRTYGYTHSHPDDKAPGYEDVMIIVRNTKNAAFVTDPVGLAEYKEVAFVTAITSNGNYTVTIKNWPAALSKLESYDLSATSTDADYQNNFEAYLLDHQNDYAGASVYALFKTFPGMLNIYKSESGAQHEYIPLKTQPVTQTKTDIRNVNCPN